MKSSCHAEEETPSLASCSGVTEPTPNERMKAQTNSLQMQRPTEEELRVKNTEIKPSLEKKDPKFFDFDKLKALASLLRKVKSKGPDFFSEKVRQKCGELVSFPGCMMESG